MQLFSKRNKGYSLRPRLRLFQREDADSSDTVRLINEKCRNRIWEEINFITSSLTHLSRFLLLYDENNEGVSLYDGSIKDFSLRELGYSFVEFFNFNQRIITKVNDEVLFDLMESLIVFAKTREERASIIQRFKKILQEERAGFDIRDFRIVDTTKRGFTTMIPLLKDELIQSKLQKLVEAQSGGDSSQSAKITADITQFIFSSNKKKGTETVAKGLCKKLAKCWTDQKNLSELSDLISQQVSLIKKFNNRLQDIRHTDKHTIPMVKPDFIQFVSNVNSQIIELFILSLPEQFFSSIDPDSLKTYYLKEYGIDENHKWIIEQEINLDDIPF